MASVRPPASGTGRAARRTLRTLREESRDYFDGVVGLGDQATIAEAERAYRVSAAFREEVRRTYAKPPNFRTAWNILARRRLLLLSGPAHRGKWTSSVRLTAACSQVIKLDPSVQLARLHHYRFEDRTGYIIDTLSRSSAALLDHFTLDLLSEFLSERNAFLVVTVDTAARPEDAALEGFEVFWDELPDRYLALCRHARWLLGDDQATQARVEQCMNDPIVAKELAKAHEPRQIAEIATVLVDGAHAGLTAEQSLANRAALQRAGVIHRFQKADLAGQALMISLAVFDGLSYSRMLRASEQLHKMLHARLNKSLAKSARGAKHPDLTNLQRSARLGMLQAETFMAEERREHGPQLVRAVRYENHQSVYWVLGHLWEEHDVLRRPVIGWLRKLVLDPDPEVRWAAGVTLGILSTSDFAYLLDEVFAPWADGDDYQRLATAIALGVPAAHAEHFPQVDSLLRMWSRSGSPRQRWTAAISYGLVFGHMHPHIALDELRLLGDSRNPVLRTVLPVSVVRLFAAGDAEPTLYRTVLEALVDWTSDRSLPRATVGRAAFLELVGSGDQSDSPALFWRSVRADRACVLLGATLWRRALIEPDNRGRTYQALQQAFRLADRDADLARGLRGVMAEILRTAPPAEIAPIRYHLDKWTNDPRESSATAQTIVRGLDEGGASA